MFTTTGLKRSSSDGEERPERTSATATSPETRRVLGTSLIKHQSSVSQDDNDPPTPSPGPVAAVRDAARKTRTNDLNVVTVQDDARKASILEYSTNSPDLALDQRKHIVDNFLGEEAASMVNRLSAEEDIQALPQPTGLTRSTRQRQQAPPGAFAIDGIGGPNQDFEAMESQEPAPAGVISEEELAAARPVADDDGEGLPQAEHFDDKEEAEAARERRRQDSKRAAKVVGIGLVVIVGTALLLGFLLARREPKESESLTPAPTPAPTTQSEKLWNLLPEYTQSEVLKPYSAQKRAFDWMLEDPYFRIYSDDKMIQRFALAVLYYATEGEGWSASENWTSYDHHECEWQVQNQCGLWNLWENETAMWEAGDVPCHSWDYPEDISNLSNVHIPFRHLWLYENHLRGSLPVEINLLTSIKTISLCGNRLTGSISSHIGQLTDLEAIGLTGLGLSGSLPSQLGLLSNFQSIKVPNNNFHGTLPTELGLMTNMQYLLLDMNKFSGQLPSEIGLLSKLSWLDVVTNSLRSTIPTQFGQWSDIGFFLINYNPFFYGTVPSQMGLLSTLTTFRLHDNKNMTGTLPSELGLLGTNGALQVLNVTGTSIGGTMPSDLCGIGDGNCTHPYIVCGVYFGCSDSMCGCDCDCNSDELVLSNASVVPSSGSHP